MGKLFELGLGFIFGFLFAIATMQWFYKRLLKEVIDEIHRQYKIALKKQKEELTS